ncbi:MAG TPA: hypothetical protein VMB80_18370 [Candidatus Acidoferrum sp.]|nr:hypothetical protein [Candidatus Acidoferrum sp.]
MKRWFIQGLNCALLGLIFIGLPAATRAQWGSWQISPGPQTQWLMFWSLVLAVAGNIVAALGPVKSSRERKLCWEWAVVFAVLLLAQFAYQRGYIHFEWLKQSLLWLQKHL